MNTVLLTPQFTALIETCALAIGVTVTGIAIVCALLFLANIWRRTWLLPSVGVALFGTVGALVTTIALAVKGEPQVTAAGALAVDGPGPDRRGGGADVEGRRDGVGGEDAVVVVAAVLVAATTGGESEQGDTGDGDGANRLPVAHQATPSVSCTRPTPGRADRLWGEGNC